MPPLPYVPNVLKVVPSGTIGDSTWAMVWHFKFTGTPPASSADAATVASNINAAWVTNLKTLQATYWNVTKIAVSDLTSAVGAYGESVSVISGSGDSTSAPASACVLVRKLIHRRYRGSHPRFYWPSPGATNIADDDNWKTTYLTAFQSGLNAFMTAMSTISTTTISTLLPVNISYYNGFTNYTRPNGAQDHKPTLRATPLVDDVVSQLAMPKIATQRNRL